MLYILHNGIKTKPIRTFLRTKILFSEVMGLVVDIYTSRVTIIGFAKMYLRDLRMTMSFKTRQVRENN